MKVSLILPSFKRPELLNLGLWSLSQQEINHDLEIIVLNDGVKDNTEKVCNEFKNKLNIRYIFTGKRNLDGKTIFRCPTFAVNIGIKQSKGDIIILSSPEIFHLNNSVNLLIAPLIDNKKIMSSPEDIFLDNIGKAKNFLSKNFTLKIPENIVSSLESNTVRIRYGRTLPFFMGMYKKELIDIGGYDEDFIGWGGDDDDLVWRLKENGLKYHYCNAKIIHLYHDKQYNLKGKNQDKNYWYNVKLLRERKGIIKRNIGREWGCL